MRCTECTDGFCPFLPENAKSTVKCKKCGNESSIVVSDVLELWQKMESCDSSEKDMDKLQRLYDKCEKVFSPYNVALCRLAETIMGLALAMENYAIAAKYTEKTFICFSTFYPRLHPALTVRTYEYSKMLMLDRKYECLQFLQQAFQMMCDSYGPESDFAAETEKILNDVLHPDPSHE
ncbi:unnamed protein product [Gongylonema pulchrum]|uniref:Uncharacterized protein n=1 Tax=Gongylonema pulchrum TaxID=637853 RepID=A0A3P7MB25_9BILA|nr:unnamed protein product [Gongylonema pulchrum]